MVPGGHVRPVIALVSLVVFAAPAYAQGTGWMSVEPKERMELLGCYDEPGASGESEHALLTFRNISDQRIVRVFPEGPEWIAVLLDPRMDKSHRDLEPGDTDVVRLASNCRESMQDQIEAAWDGFGSCPDPYVVTVEVDGTKVEEHEVEVCIFCQHGQIEIPERERIRLVGTDGCPATGSFEVVNGAPICELRDVAITGPNDITIEPANFSVSAAGVDLEVVREHSRTVNLTAPCRGKPPVRTETLSVTSKDLDDKDASIELQVTVECSPTTQIAISDYPRVVQSNARRRDLQFRVVAGDPEPPLKLEFRGTAGCSPERWFECGDGAIHEARIPASAPGPLYQAPFLLCYGDGEGPGTQVNVVGRAILVDGNGCESRPADFPYTCQY
jgi:hypothetical protein